MRAIRKQARNFAAVLVLMVIAGAVGFYILGNQRVRFPWEGDPFVLNAELSTAQAVAPGQGQTVRVSGVRIGDIGDVTLQDGTARVQLKLDPEFDDLIHTDATALLRPKTGLKDMFLEIDPGSDRAPVAKRGWTMPVANTLPDVNPDEILGALDTDSREYLQLLINGAGRGLEGRAGSLQDVLRRFEPTHRDLAKVSGAVADRRENLRRLTHSLNLLNTELGSKDDELADLVKASDDVFGSLSSVRPSISRSLADLPPALDKTTSALGKVQRFADVLGPTADQLRPALRSITANNAKIRPFVRDAAPILRNAVRPFVRRARPTVRSLKPAAAGLASTVPPLTRSFTVLNTLFNYLAYNKDGREGPEQADRDEGYLFWAAWLQHNGASVFSASDANGVLRPITVGGACPTLRQTADQNPPLGMVLGPALLDPTICGGNGA